jgi:hypothetical protein
VLSHLSLTHIHDTRTKSSREMHFLRDLYREKFEVDNRDPLITFSFGQNEYGVKAPSLLWWTQFLVFIGVTASAYLIVWAVTYYCYVSKHSSHNQSLLFGYGVLLPLIPAIPYMFASYLDIRNTFQRYAVVTMYPVLTWFKTVRYYLDDFTSSCKIRCKSQI